MKRLAVVLLLAGCAYEPVLVPDPTARSPDGKVAFAEAQGVQVAVNAEAWHSDPLDLSDVLTPVHVSVDNRGALPLRVAFNDFALVGSSGMRYSALAPLQTESRSPQQLPRSALERPGPITVDYHPYHHASPYHVPPRFHSHRYFIAPHYGWYYPGYPLWGAPFPYGGYVYSWPRQLPTPDMIAESLPEGVLEPGGHVDGFIYFQGVQQREAAVRFDMQLVDATSSQPFGTASIPLRVRGH